MNKMEKILYLYTHKLFPRFSTPNSSRFSELFSKLSDYDPDSDFNGQLNKIYSKDLKENPNIEKYRINPEKILNGLEKRTSIIIKGIPSDFGALNFYELITQFCIEINFFYIPGFSNGKRKYMYAFVTVGRLMDVLNIFEALILMRDKLKIYKGFNFTKIEIYFCKYQNLIDLTKKYQKEVDQKNFIICK